MIPLRDQSVDQGNIIINLVQQLGVENTPTGVCTRSYKLIKPFPLVCIDIKNRSFFYKQEERFSKNIFNYTSIIWYISFCVHPISV